MMVVLPQPGEPVSTMFLRDCSDMRTLPHIKDRPWCAAYRGRTAQRPPAGLLERVGNLFRTVLGRAADLRAEVVQPGAEGRPYPAGDVGNGRPGITIGPVDRMGRVVGEPREVERPAADVQDVERAFRA